MIHLTRYPSATILPRASKERLDLIHRPITDFAEYLHGRRTEKGLEPKIQARMEPSTPDQAHDRPIPPRTRDNPTLPVEPPPDPDGWQPAEGPGPLRFKHVPDAAKYPNGPYRQAPEEFGGEWWLVNPFTGDEPWTALSFPTEPTPPDSPESPSNLPEGFVEAFGEKPVRRPGEEAIDFVGRLSRWRQDLKYFKQTGIPEGFTDVQVDALGDVYEQWGLGRPVFYEGRYGWFARFPESALPEFEVDARSAMESSNLAIARYQVRLLQKGIVPDATHPLVPPGLVTA